MSNQLDSLITQLQTSAPVNVNAIAKGLGIEVYESHDLPIGIAGKIFRDPVHGGTSGYSIVVRGADAYVRKRFTVAHEIGHYLLHRHLFSSGEIVDDALYRSQLSTRLEVQANALAADLLMPWHLLIPVITKPVSELAKMFEVSEQAMQIRIDSHWDFCGLVSSELR